MSTTAAVAEPMTSTGSTRPPPMDAGWPVVGHIPGFFKDRAGVLSKLYKKHGPVFQMKLGPDAPVVLAGPEFLLFALKDAGKVLHAAPKHANFVAELGGMNLLLGADLEPHFHRRKQLMPLFTPRAVGSFVPRLAEITTSSLADWKPGTSVDLVDWMKRLVTRQAGLLLANKSAEHLHDDICTFIDLSVGVAMAGFMPGFVLKMPKYKNAKKRVLDFCAALLAERRAMPKEERPGDLIDIIVDSIEADGSETPEGERLALVVLPFAAGLDTVAHTAAFLMYELMASPTLLARCVAEADSVFTDGRLDPSKVRSLEVLAAVVTETLRMYPMADVNQRVAAETFEFAGCRIEKGTPIMQAGCVSHSLEAFYKEPGKFDPDRCLAPRNEHLQPGAFGAFGAGPHKCIGSKLGEVQLLITIAAMLNKCTFELDPKGYKMKMVSFPVIKPKNLRMKAFPRS